MAIRPTCDVDGCGRELTDFGAILLGPVYRPVQLEMNGKKHRKKYHICKECYPKVSEIKSPFRDCILIGPPDEEGLVEINDVGIEIIGA